MCFRSASGCSADSSTSGLFVDFKRRKLVLDFGEEDLRFIVCGLAKRNYPDFLRCLRVYDGDRNALQQSQCHESALAVGETIVLKRERRTCKDCLGIDKVQSVVPKVGQAFVFAPAVSHLRSVYTRRTHRNRVRCTLTPEFSGRPPTP
jgi:hypothetical protein